MLLADANIEKSLREFLREVEKTGRRGHRRGDGADVGVSRRRRQQRLAENVGVSQLGAQGMARQWIEGADAVQLVDLILDRRTITVTLLGHDMDNHGLPQAGRSAQHLLERCLVVPVDQSGVLDAQRLEDR